MWYLIFFNTGSYDNNIGLSLLLSQAKSNCFAGFVVSIRAEFWRVLDLCAQPEWEVIEAVGARLEEYFAIGGMEEEDAVL